MEKKSFLSGISAKIALSIVALSGALLTGCYKDDGLDVNGVKLPDPTYTIAGQVIDAETLAPIDGATVSGGVTASVVNGAFSVNVTTAQTYTLTVSKSGYNDATVNVDVKAVNQGQSAVYTTVIALQSKYEGKYTLAPTIVDETGAVVSGASYEIRDLSGATVKNGELEGGNSYILVVSAEGYTTSQVTVELPKAKEATTQNVYVVLSKQATGTVKLCGEVKVGDKTFSARKIELKDNAGNLLGIDEGYTFNFEVSESYFAAATRATGKSATFKMNIVDNNGIEFAFDKTFTIAASSEGSSSQASSDVIIAVKLTSTDKEVELAKGGESATYIFENNTEENDTYSFVAKDNVAKAYVESTDYIASLESAGVTTSSNFYDVIVAALNPSSLSTTVTKKDTKQTVDVPSLSALASYNWIQKGTSLTREVAGFTVDGSDVTIAALKKVVGVSSTEVTPVADLEITAETVYLGHGHSHAHGADNNAGGGIGNAE